MKIIIDNQTFNLDLANTFLKKLRGLMGQEKITKGMFFPKTRSIHTFFMKDNIDVIMLNNQNEIIFWQKNVPKGKIIIKKEAYHTIELPRNSINNIHLKDKVIIR